jgi:hypothetical protein
MPIAKVRQLKQQKKLETRVMQSQLQVNAAQDIPWIDLLPTNVRTFNFVFKGQVDNYSFSPRDLCRMISVAHPGAGTTDIFPAFLRVRVQKIELWGGVGPSPGNTTPGVMAWVNRTLTDGVPQRLIGAVRQDVQAPASFTPSHVVLTPKQKVNSIFRQWFEQDDNDYLFTVSAGLGTIMQITVCYSLNLSPPNISNSITTNSYLDVTGRPALGLSALDSGNATGFRIVVPIPISNSTSTQIPIFD